MRRSSVTLVLWPPMVTVQVLPCVESEPKFCAMPLYPDATIVPLDTAALGRLFDCFYRADPARSAETGGFGIGLSIARSIAEGHRGTIRAESPDGRTIVFTAELK